MKQLVLTITVICFVSRAAFCAVSPADALFQHAQAAIDARQFDDAVRWYERVFIEQPTRPDLWFEAQRCLVMMLARKGDLAEAAKAAHICLDGAPDLGRYRAAVDLTAWVLSAMDKQVDRANQFVAFQQSGPANGLTNPMVAVGYPTLPERERAFEAMRRQAGDDAAASRLRAFTFLFTGKPRDAMAQFADAFRRSSQLRDLQRSGPDLVIVGLRAVRGHAVGLEAGMRFVQFGPNGPDGLPKTADDIADPFPEFLPAPPAPGQGGLAGMSKDDLAVLRQVQEAARLYTADIRLDCATRVRAIDALARTNDALDDWAAPGQRDWYFQLAQLPTDARMPPRFSLSPHIEGRLFYGAQTAARGRALHFGGAHLLWHAIDAYCIAQGIKPTEAMMWTRKQFTDACDALTRPGLDAAPLKMLVKPAAF